MMTSGTRLTAFTLAARDGRTWLYVIDDEITAEVDGQRSVLRAGGCAFVPRGTAHTFQNFGQATAHMLATVVPGSNFNRFFEEVSAANHGLPVPDLARTAQIMNAHGLELLGPPLSR